MFRQVVIHPDPRQALRPKDMGRRLVYLRIVQGICIKKRLVRKHFRLERGRRSAGFAKTARHFFRRTIKGSRPLPDHRLTPDAEPAYIIGRGGTPAILAMTKRRPEHGPRRSPYHRAAKTMPCQFSHSSPLRCRYLERYNHSDAAPYVSERGRFNTVTVAITMVAPNTCRGANVCSRTTRPKAAAVIGSAIRRDQNQHSAGSSAIVGNGYGHRALP